MEKEYIILNEERNVNLTAYIQEVGGKFGYIEKRPAILVLPGGGYQYCSDREADSVALSYVQAGYQAFILRYSVGEHSVWPNPLTDVENALELIRSREDWHVYEDKVAVIGFSAGGHLAAAAATMSKHRPNAAILGYAVAGNDVKGCNLSAPDTTKYVDGNTCPCFVFATRTDEMVPIQNSIDFISALDKANVAFESHIYAYGPHGFSVANSSVHNPNTPICERVPHWVSDSIGWLKDMFGDFGRGEMTEPTCKSHFTGDNDPYLSVDCTIGHLLKNEKAREVLSDIMDQFETNQEMLEAVSRMQIKGVLGFFGTPEEEIEDLDAKLNKIANV